MENKIEIFLFVLSFVFILRFLFEFLLQLREENPKTILITKTERVFIYLSISYIITFFLTL